MQTPSARTLALRTNTVTYPGSTEHISAVRADLRSLLRDCPMADEVILCASELAANAALHSRSRLPGGTFTVTARINLGDHALVEVKDQGGPWAPPGRDLTRHHGLAIVGALATGWGIDGDHTSRIIWARFDWSDGPLPEPAGSADRHRAVCTRPVPCEDFLHYQVKGTPSGRATRPASTGL